MKQFFPALYANDTHAARIGQAVLDGTLSHAYIIEGPNGSGKLFFALQIAAALACEKKGDDTYPLPCGTCPHCRRVLGGNSPDVHILDTDNKTIGVDAIKNMRSDMYLSSTEEDKKVYIINDAHRMTVQAQNALLIVLEEPPSDCVVFLLTDRRDSLITTICSRASDIRMHLLDIPTMDSALSAVKEAVTLKKNDPDTYEMLLENAAGCLGVAMGQMEKKARGQLQKEREIASEAVKSLLSTTSYRVKIAAMKSLPDKRSEAQDILESMLVALRDLILLARDHDAPLLFYTEREAANTLSEQAGIQHLLRAYDRVSLAWDALSNNANLTLTLSTLFTEN